MGDRAPAKQALASSARRWTRKVKTWFGLALRGLAGWRPVKAGASVTRPAGQKPDASEGRKTMWVFGYGSLMWDDWEKGFGCLRKVRASLPEFRRAFNRASVRNWGTEEHPCPTLNLVADPKGVCEGYAFEFDEARHGEVIRYLNNREGYLEPVKIILHEGRTSVNAITPMYKRRERIIKDKTGEDLAKMAISAVGTSGECMAYIRNIAAELDRLGIDEPEVKNLLHALNGLRAGSP